MSGAKLPAPDDLAEDQAAQAWFDEMGRICREAGVPWVMLLAGVTSERKLPLERDSLKIETSASLRKSDEEVPIYRSADHGRTGRR
jgi:hypothetical protein